MKENRAGRILVIGALIVVAVLAVIVVMAFDERPVQPNPSIGPVKAAIVDSRVKLWGRVDSANGPLVVEASYWGREEVQQISIGEGGWFTETLSLKAEEESFLKVVLRDDGKQFETLRVPIAPPTPEKR